MSFKRVVVLIILSVIFVLLIIELFSLYRDVHQLQSERTLVGDKLYTFQSENDRIQHDMIYYQDPQNLEKSLREKFNYKRPGETMIIIVPRQE